MVLFLILAILQSYPAHAQTSSEERKEDRLLRLSSQVEDDGRKLPDQDGEKILMERMNKLIVHTLMPPTDAYLRTVERAKQLEDSDYKPFLHYFDYTYEDVDVCFKAIFPEAKHPDEMNYEKNRGLCMASEICKKFMEDVLNTHPGAVTCSLEPRTNGTSEIRCLYPHFISHDTDQEDRMMKILPHIGKRGSFSPVKRNKCNAPIESGYKNNLAIWLDEVKVGEKTIPDWHYIPIPGNRSNRAPSGMADRYHDEAMNEVHHEEAFLEKVKQELNKKTGIDYDAGIKAYQGRFLIGIPREKKIALVIDGTGNTANRDGTLNPTDREKVFDQTLKTLSTLGPDQSFSIAIFNDHPLYFDHGKTMKATPENLAAVKQFFAEALKTQPGTKEKVNDALTFLDKADSFDAAYMITDGNIDYKSRGYRNSDVDEVDHVQKKAKKDQYAINIKPTSLGTPLAISEMTNGTVFPPGLQRMTDDDVTEMKKIKAFQGTDADLMKLMLKTEQDRIDQLKIRAEEEYKHNQSLNMDCSK